MQHMEAGDASDLLRRRTRRLRPRNEPRKPFRSRRHLRSSRSGLDSDSDSDATSAKSNFLNSLTGGHLNSGSNPNVVVISNPQQNNAPTLLANQGQTAPLNQLAPQRQTAPVQNAAPVLGTTRLATQSVLQQQTTTFLSSILATTTPLANAAPVMNLEQSPSLRTSNTSLSSTTSATRTTATEASQTSDADSKAASPSATARDPKRDNRLDGGAEAGIVIGVLAAIILLALTFVFVRRYRRKRSSNKFPPTARMMPEISAPIPIHRDSDAMTVSVGYLESVNSRLSRHLQEPQPVFMEQSGDDEYFQRRVYAEPAPEMAEGASERSHQPLNFI
ncbi:hypothetical protein CDD80_1810 [Ophiocordyceps camponoti-rufipedis]|uniref:Mid2 domain-containing protein n=1 Tax=Ophiocordyceps camponoti-rufipedis TaxID=2004952 RepID=A0A2C5ZEM4_9HYPO|nr:hypothetical protein CDD80_1810 [Ophiocordyceps camponoti-rufipedis]